MILKCFVFVCLIEYLIIVTGLRGSEDPWVVDYGKYYYKDLRMKLTESMSTNNCSLNGHGLLITRPDFNSEEATAVDEFDFSVELVHPSDVVKSVRGSLGKEKLIDSTKLFLQVSPNLCKSKLWAKFKTGEMFRFSTGCAVGVSDGGNSQDFKVADRGAGALHPGHIRCDRAAAITACTSGSQGPMLVRKSDRQFHNYPFAITANKGTLVSPSGHLTATCGVFGLHASCESVELGIRTAVANLQFVKDCQLAHAEDRSIEPITERHSCPFPRIDRVFVMSQFDDLNPDRFLTESLPRLVYHLDYVLSNYNMAIHFGYVGNRGRRPPLKPVLYPRVRAYMDWLGLTPRLVNGTVYADEAYVPREGGCQDASYNAWEIVNQREALLRLSTHKPFKKTIHNEIVQRFAHVDFEEEIGKSFVIFVRSNLGASSVNSASDEVVSTVEAFVKTSFPQYEFRVYPPHNRTLHYCPPCDIRLFARAAVVIGGNPSVDLSNVMFMKPGGMVVEAVWLQNFDPRVAPVIGAVARLASVVGLHHYTLGIDSNDLNIEQLLKSILTFHDKVMLWHG